MAQEIVNKVAQSGLITIDLSKILPDKSVRTFFDMKDFLFRGLILKEKDFREALKEHKWEQYKNKYVAVSCSTDAIVPHWAYMLVASYLEAIAIDSVVGDEKILENTILRNTLTKLDLSKFKDQRLVIKGCGDPNIDANAYYEITRILKPVAKSIMYGEPCSTVPVYKQPK